MPTGLVWVPPGYRHKTSTPESSEGHMSPYAPIVSPERSAPSQQTAGSRAARGHGVFLAFEGIDGTGKSGAAHRAVEWLKAQGIEAALVRDPGGTPFAEELRDLLVRTRETKADKRAEMILYTAARTDLWFREIEPRLRNGVWVVADRFVGSTLAYQGYGRGIDMRSVAGAHVAACGEDAWPDATLLLDAPPEVAIRRAVVRNEESENGEGRYEAMPTEFHIRVRNGYLSLAEADPSWTVIDTNRPQDDVLLAVERTLGLVLDTLRTSAPAP